MSNTVSIAKARAKADKKQPAAAQPISRLNVPALEALDEATKKLVALDGGANWTRAMAVSPNTLRRFMTYYLDLMSPTKGRLPLRERELLAVIVSHENGCGYCTLNHTQGLADALKDPVRAKRIATDHHLVDLSEREEALAELAVAITQDPRSVNEEDFAYLHDLGLDDEEIAEAIEIIAWFNHSNRLAVPLGIVPDTHFFK
jgi:uncharacterized peroxidase-related enzyme